MYSKKDVVEILQGIYTQSFYICVSAKTSNKFFLHKAGFEHPTTSWYPHYWTCIHRMPKYHLLVSVASQNAGTKGQKEPLRWLQWATKNVCNQHKREKKWNIVLLYFNGMLTIGKEYIVQLLVNKIRNIR